MRNSLVLIASLIFIVSCAGPNPNPGERLTDMHWTSGNFKAAFVSAKRSAENGRPWAQLRLGIFYTNGWGTEKDIEKSIYWYKKAIAQKGTGAWAEGKLIGAVGEGGYFNKNSDARLAEFNLAQIYLTENTNLEEALKLINNVIEETNGKSVFFCCEFAGGRYFNPKQFIELKTNIENKLNENKS